MVLKKTLINGFNLNSKMATSSSLTSLEDKATKEVCMRCNDAGENDHHLVVDDDGSRNGFEKPATSLVSFKDMLLGGLKGYGKEYALLDKIC